MCASRVGEVSDDVGERGRSLWAFMSRSSPETQHPEDKMLTYRVGLCNLDQL